MEVDNVSVSSVFGAADRGPDFTPPVSYLSETTLVSYSYTTTSRGSRTKTATRPASTYTTPSMTVSHNGGGNQDCYTSIDGMRGDYTTAVVCSLQNYHQCATAIQKSQTLTSIQVAPTPTSGIHLDILSQHPLVQPAVPNPIPTIPGHAARDLSSPPAALSSQNGLLIATGTPDFTLPTNSLTIPFSTSTSTPISSPSPSDSQGHLSPASKIAIIITIPLSIFLLFLLTFLCFRYRRRKLRRRHRVRHDLSVPAPREFTPTRWPSSSHADSKTHLIPLHTPTLHSKDPESYPTSPDHHPDLQPPTPIYEAEARSIRSSGVKIVEIGPGKREWGRGMEGIVELADTSRKSVKEWARRSVWSVRSHGGGTRKSRLPGYEEFGEGGGNGKVGRSWFEDGPPSPALQTPMRAKFEIG